METQLQQDEESQLVERIFNKNLEGRLQWKRNQKWRIKAYWAQVGELMVVIWQDNAQQTHLAIETIDGRQQLARFSTKELPHPAAAQLVTLWATVGEKQIQRPAPTLDTFLAALDGL